MMTDEVPELRRPEALTVDDIVLAQATATYTAASLLADAQLLMQHRRWPRATSLAILAIEEVAKVRIAGEILSAGSDPKQLARAWGRYRNHGWKATEMVITKEMMQGTLAEREAARKALGDSWDRLKQLGFYSNSLRDGRWVTPEEVVTKKRAESFVSFAQVLVGQLSSLLRGKLGG